jgi:hypothetical protein
VWDSNDIVYLEFIGTRERLDEPFEIQDGIVVAPGEYDYGRVRLETELSNARTLSGSVALETGTFYDGTRDDLFLTAYWRPSALLNASLSYQRSGVDLDAGDFVAHVGRLRVDLAFDEHVLWSNFAQVDNQSDTLGLNSRLRWILAPGQEFYVVLNPLIEREAGSLVATEIASAFKVAWTLRF